MKKYLLPIMALALTFSFVACGDDEDSPTPKNEQSGTQDDSGNKPATTINYLYSFDKKTYSLVDETEITLTIFNAQDGTELAVEQDTKVTLSVYELSTAKAEDYEFPAEITIPAAKSKISFKVKSKNANPEPKANRFILIPTFPSNNFKAGQYKTAKVELIASFAKDLIGTWVMNKLVTDKESMDATWGGMATYGDAYPAFNAEDQLTIGATLEPAFKSTFKNFFIGEATYEDAGSYAGIRVGLQPIQLSVLKVTGVNRYFSADEQSENKVAYIGVRNITDEETNETLLDVYLLDYESHSFAPELLDFGMYLPDGDFPYMAYQTGMYINFTMKKAQ